MEYIVEQLSYKIRETLFKNQNYSENLEEQVK